MHSCVFCLFRLMKSWTPVLLEHEVLLWWIFSRFRFFLTQLFESWSSKSLSLLRLGKGKLIIRLASPNRNLNAKCCSLQIFFYFPQIKKQNALYFVCTFRKWIWVAAPPAPYFSIFLDNFRFKNCFFDVFYHLNQILLSLSLEITQISNLLE